MKRSRTISTVIVVALIVMMFSACGKAEFGMTENTGKAMAITAKNAEADSWFTAGSLDVEEGEMIRISANLTKGSIRVEVFGPDEKSINESPDLDGEVVITANLKTTYEASGTVPAGSYRIKATCLEKATGTVDILVEPES